MTIMEIMGKPAINPFLFYSGKISGYVVWILLVLSISGKVRFRESISLNLDYLSYFLLVFGFFISVAGLLRLGRSTRFGLPVTKTTLRASGIYRISRNPIYLGFNLITIASMVYLPHPVIIIPGIYCMIVYHQIIIAEEKFLEEAFKEDYLNYKKRVRRYL